MNAEKLKKMVEDNRNGIPCDKNGIPLETGKWAVGEIIKDQPEVLVGGKPTFLGPRVRRICGKLITVGSKKSWIQPENGLSEGADNDKITIIA